MISFGFGQTEQRDVDVNTCWYRKKYTHENIQFNRKFDRFKHKTLHIFWSVICKQVSTAFAFCEHNRLERATNETKKSTENETLQCRIYDDWLVFVNLAPFDMHINECVYVI